MKISNTLWQKTNTEDKYFIEDLKKSKKIDNNLINFGTAGLRNKMGVGLSKINEYTIAGATIAFAKFLKGNFKDYQKGVVLANDTRANGNYYRDIAATVLNSFGIKTYKLEDFNYMATPLISHFIIKKKLVGGINITASHNPKEYNGFKIYNRFGSQFTSEESNEIFNIFKGINFNDIVTKKAPKYENISLKELNEYISDVAKISISKPGDNDIKIAYSSLMGTGTKVADKLFKEMNVKSYVADYENELGGNFKKLKSLNPEEVRSYDHSIKLARKKKADIALITDPDADRVGVASKHKKRWKYISGNQLAILYTDMLLKKLKKANRLKKDSYIVKSLVSTNLVDKIAEKYGVKVIKTHVGFKNISNVIQKRKGTFLLAFEESFGLLINPEIAQDKDAFQGIVAAVDVARELKKQNKDMFTRLNEMYKEYGIYRNIKISKKIDNKQLKHIFKVAKKNKKIGSQSIKSVINYNDKNDLGEANVYQINFKNGSSIIMRPSGTEPKTSFYLENISSGNQKMIDISFREEEIKNFIKDNSEVIEEKRITRKAIIKYSLFLAFIILIMVFVFKVVFEMNSSGKGVFKSIGDLYAGIGGYKILILVLSMLFVGTLSSWMRKRLISFQGQKVKWRHLLISGYMGIIISYVTPFTIGGDAIGYWYLRKKGVKRGPLLSSFMISTIMYQIAILAQSAVFLPVGMPIYKVIFDAADPQSHAALIMFIINVSWDIFATFMIISLVTIRRYQEWIVVTATKFLEWIPFIRIRDAASSSSIYQYELREMRRGIKKLWHNKWILLEAITYEMIPRFFMVGALFNIWFGVIKPNLPVGQYWTQVISFDLVSTANSMSITPGGSGTGEWLDTTINQHIYQPTSAGNSFDTAMSLNVIHKFTYQWPLLIVSALLIFTIILGEQRSSKYKKAKKLNTINGTKTNVNQSSFYKKATIPWVLGVSTWFVLVGVL